MRFRQVIVFCLSVSCFASNVIAEPQITGEALNDGTTYRYLYTVANASADEVFGFDLSPVFGVTNVVLPNDGWSFIATADSIQFVAFDDGVSVAPGASLSGFGFDSTFGPGETTYFVVTDTGGDYGGNTIGPVHVVPEPNSLYVAVIGLAMVLVGFVWHRRSRVA